MYTGKVHFVKISSDKRNINDTLIYFTLKIILIGN